MTIGLVVPHMDDLALAYMKQARDAKAPALALIRRHQAARERALQVPRFTVRNLPELQQVAAPNRHRPPRPRAARAAP